MHIQRGWPRHAFDYIRIYGWSTQQGTPPIVAILTSTVGHCAIPSISRDLNPMGQSTPSWLRTQHDQAFAIQASFGGFTGTSFGTLVNVSTFSGSAFSASPPETGSKSSRLEMTASSSSVVR